MRNRRGSVLVYVLVAVVILYAIAAATLRSSLQAKMLQAKERDKARAVGALEAARAQAVACLRQAGYPLASCAEPLPSCLPSRIGIPAASVAFRSSGDYAADHFCKLGIDVILPGGY